MTSGAIMRPSGHRLRCRLARRWARRV